MNTSTLFSWLAVALAGAVLAFDMLMPIAERVPDTKPGTQVRFDPSFSSPKHETVASRLDLDKLAQRFEPFRLSSLDNYRREIQPFIDDGEFQKARAILLEYASVANADEDHDLLGLILALIGELSIQGYDLHTAEVYLNESLETFERIGNDIGTAYALMHLGRMHITSRALARHAAGAYDLLLIARNQLAGFRYESARENLNTVITQSLEIDRYGTAADALETLARLNRSTGQTYEAERALLKAAELYAASGGERRAGMILDELASNGVDPVLISHSRGKISAFLAEFEQNTRQLRQAEDYRMLFHHYRANGDQQRAWEFRIRAERTLAQASKRAMYYRQPDVLALLYNSNTDMSRARSYVDRASGIFLAEGADEWTRKVQNLSSKIF